jgi:hypothetical protein
VVNVATPAAKAPVVKTAAGVKAAAMKAGA